MIIDRKNVEDTFKKYTDNYDTSDEKIKLKVDHTYRVAALSERIAISLGLDKADTDLAWLIGMLHDIGRFEQLKNYGTFSDADSIDHAHYGVELLFDEGLIWKFIDKTKLKADIEDDKSEDKLKKEFSELDILKTAIFNHSAYRIEEGLPEKVQMFCNIIRDADKIDILKVNYDVTLEVIYDVTTVEGPNDYASMYEVLKRRFSHGLMEIEQLNEKNLSNEFGSFTKFPDLIMMDGGVGQVHIAMQVLSELDIDIPVCGMVKDDNHRTRGLFFDEHEIPIDTNSEGFRLMTRIQDEVHRFAIEYHRSLRSKEQVKSILDDIPGIGEKRRKALMKHFASIEAIKNAAIDELARAESMNEKAAASVYKFFHQGGAKE